MRNMMPFLIQKNIMIEFTRFEKSVVIAILVAIMEADGIIDPREMDYLNEVIKNLGLTEGELDQMDEFDLNVLKNMFREFEKEKKDEAVRLFVGMAESDGYSDPRELEIIERLGQ